MRTCWRCLVTSSWWHRATKAAKTSIARRRPARRWIWTWVHTPQGCLSAGKSRKATPCWMSVSAARRLPSTWSTSPNWSTHGMLSKSPKKCWSMKMSMATTSSPLCPFIRKPATTSRRSSTLGLLSAKEPPTGWHPTMPAPLASWMRKMCSRWQTQQRALDNSPVRFQHPHVSNQWLPLEPCTTARMWRALTDNPWHRQYWVASPAPWHVLAAVAPHSTDALSPMLWHQASTSYRPFLSWPIPNWLDWWSIRKPSLATSTHWPPLRERRWLPPT